MLELEEQLDELLELDELQLELDELELLDSQQEELLELLESQQEELDELELESQQSEELDELDEQEESPEMSLDETWQVLLVSSHSLLMELELEELEELQQHFFFLQPPHFFPIYVYYK